MSICKLLIAAVVTFTTTVHAEPTPIDDDPELGSLFVQGGLTSNVAAHRAKDASPAKWRRLAELESAISAIDTATLARVPIVTTKLSYTRMSPLDDVGPAGAGMVFPTFPDLVDRYGAQAQIVVPLSDYVLRHPGSIASARIGADAARANVRASELGAAYAARRAYYEWIRARLQLVIATRQLAQVRGSMQQVSAIVGSGRLPRADLLRIESKEAEAEQLVDRLRTVAGLREEALRIQIGAKPDEKLAIGEDIRQVFAARGDAALDELARIAARRRPDLRAVELGIAANGHRQDAERAHLFPALSAFATVDYANPSPRAFPQEDKFAWSWTAGVQMTWTLNDALVSRTRTRRLVAEANALRADREALSRDVRIAVLSAQLELANARRALVTTRKGLDAAEESYRVRRALLAAERITALELVDAETDLTRARISALDARIDLRIADAALAQALGSDL